MASKGMLGVSVRSDFSFRELNTFRKQNSNSGRLFLKARVMTNFYFLHGFVRFRTKLPYEKYDYL